ncbi:MAG: DUF5916 domain-containing protein [Bacteroidota bacterium]
MKSKATLTLYLLLALSWQLHAQNATPLNLTQPKIELKESSEKIILDGELNETSWFAGKPANNFYQQFPADTSRAQAGTEIYMTYDKDNLYVGIKCYAKGDEHVINSLRRDYDFFGTDNISILFDTYNDQTNAFLFGMNPYGVRREALIANGGRSFGDFLTSWDNKWFGEAKIHDGYWIAEMAIPFKTLRFKDGGDEWRFNSYRFDTHDSEISTWTHIPRNFLIMDLGYMGKMKWDKPLKKTGSNISLIPYIIGGATRDYTDVEEDSPDFSRNIGGDAKIAVTSALNLDLTINPDFSQVEVDQQVTNLDRFEIFFPERRQFFLENADLFSSFGNSRVNPFFSRRIGVGVDPNTGQNFQNPILFGARLSGKLSDKTRIGVLNMQTAKQEESGLPQFNYTVAALQQQVFSRSNLSFIFVNKDAVNPSEFNGGFNNYNRVVGLEYRIGSADNRWSGKIAQHQAFTPTDKKDKFFHFSQVEYRVRDYRLEAAFGYVGEGFEAEVGFVPRRDYVIWSPEFELYFYPKSGPISIHSINVDYREIIKIGNDGNTLLPRWSLADRGSEISWDFALKNTARASLELAYDQVFLFNDFDPTRLQEDGIFLPAGTTYQYTAFSGSFQSDQRKVFTYSIEPTIGQFFNGFRAGLDGEAGVRLQPYGNIAMAFSYNHINLADPFLPANLWLVGPRIDLTFSKNLFLTTFIQYNNQIDNLNINARLQWRFAPVSDFFLVYTDNYLTDPFSQFSVRNRGIVAKLTYWLNL